MFIVTEYAALIEVGKNSPAVGWIEFDLGWVRI